MDETSRLLGELIKGQDTLTRQVSELFDQANETNKVIATIPALVSTVNENTNDIKTLNTFKNKTVGVLLAVTTGGGVIGGGLAILFKALSKV